MGNLLKSFFFFIPIVLNTYIINGYTYLKMYFRSTKLIQYNIQYCTNGFLINYTVDN